MAQAIFDTLGFVKRLSAAGMNVGQAEALAEALTVHAFQELATKTDLRELELRLTGRLESEIKSLEVRLMSRVGSMIAASTALTVAILGALIALT